MTVADVDPSLFVPDFRGGAFHQLITGDETEKEKAEMPSSAEKDSVPVPHNELNNPDRDADAGAADSAGKEHYIATPDADTV